MRGFSVQVQPHFVEAGDDEVGVGACRAFTNQHTGVAFRAVRSTDECDVIDSRVGARCRLVVLAAVVDFKAVVGIVAVLLCNPELALACPTVCPVKRVIACAGDERVFEINSAAEHLNAIILIHVHLHVLNDGAGADTLQCDAVEFIVGAKFDAGVFYADILQHAAAIRRIVAAEGTRVAFTEGFALVRRSIAVDNEAAPLPAGVRTVRRIACHHNRRARRAGSHNL